MKNNENEKNWIKYLQRIHTWGCFSDPLKAFPLKAFFFFPQLVPTPFFLPSSLSFSSKKPLALASSPSLYQFYCSPFWKNVTILNHHHGKVVVLSLSHVSIACSSLEAILHSQIKCPTPPGPNRGLHIGIYSCERKPYRLFTFQKSSKF